MRSLVVALVLVAAVPAALPEAEAQPVPIYTISGHVYDRDGTPLDAAIVTLAPNGSSEAQSDATWADGAYSFGQLEAGTYNLTAEHGCCGRGFLKATVGGTDLETEGVDFFLTPQEPPQTENVATISGRVFDLDSDQGLRNVRLVFSNYFSSSEGGSGDSYYYGGGYQYFEVLSGEDGVYAVDVNVGQVDVWADLEDYDYTRGYFSVQENLTVDVPMRPAEQGTVTLTGVVRSTSGDAIPYAWISVSPDYSCRGDVCTASSTPVEPYPSGGGDSFYFEPRYSGYASTEADPDGSWSLTTTAGRLQVYAYANEFLPDDESVEAAAGQEITVNLTLEPIPPDSVRLSGRVTDATGGEGVPYAQISVENQKWGTYAWAQTDEDGGYEVLTKPGFTIVTVSAYSYYWAPCPVADYAAEPGYSGAPSRAYECESGERDHTYFPRILSLKPEADESRELDFTLVRAPEPDAEFVGWVVNASDEAGVPDAWVSFYNERTHDWGQAQTDENGSFRIQVHAGYYTIRAYADHYFDAVMNAEVQSGRTQQVVLEAEPGEKRYGYYGCCYAYAAAESTSGAPGAAPSPPPGGPSSGAPAVGSDASGAQRYAGEAGGLGPYDPNADLSSGGDSPALGPMLLVGAIAAAALLARLRRS